MDPIDSLRRLAARVEHLEVQVAKLTSQKEDVPPEIVITVANGMACTNGCAYIGSLSTEDSPTRDMNALASLLVSLFADPRTPVHFSLVIDASPDIIDRLTLWDCHDLPKTQCQRDLMAIREILRLNKNRLLRAAKLQWRKSDNTTGAVYLT